MAALNILVVLVMLVMEKNRDIAILMSMGARREQIQRIFVLQGMIIGGLGCLRGISFRAMRFAPSSITTIYLDSTNLFMRLSYVPFQSRWIDAFWVAGAALLVVVFSRRSIRHATRRALLLRKGCDTSDEWKSTVNAGWNW